MTSAPSVVAALRTAITRPLLRFTILLKPLSVGTTVRNFSFFEDVAVGGFRRR